MDGTIQLSAPGFRNQGASFHRNIGIGTIFAALRDQGPGACNPGFAQSIRITGIAVDHNDSHFAALVGYPDCWHRSRSPPPFGRSMEILGDQHAFLPQPANNHMVGTKPQSHGLELVAHTAASPSSTPYMVTAGAGQAATVSSHGTGVARFPPFNSNNSSAPSRLRPKLSIPLFGHSSVENQSFPGNGKQRR